MAKGKSTITTSPVPVQAVGSTGGEGGNGFMGTIKKHKYIVAGGAGVVVFGAYYLYKKHQAANAAAVPVTSTSGATSGSGGSSGGWSGSGGQGPGSTGSGSGGGGPSGGSGPSGGNNLASLFAGLQTSLTAGFAALGTEIQGLAPSSTPVGLSPTPSPNSPQPNSPSGPITPPGVRPAAAVSPALAKSIGTSTTAFGGTPAKKGATPAAQTKALASAVQTSTGGAAGQFDLPPAKAVAKAPNPTSKVPTTKSAVTPVETPAQIAANAQAKTKARPG